MQVKYLAEIVGTALLLTDCSPGDESTPAGRDMRFVQEKPGTERQPLETVTNKQSSWLSGQNGDEGGSMHGAANTLRNQVTAMGGNAIYDVGSSTQNLLSSFIPIDSEVNSRVYKCPN